MTVSWIELARWMICENEWNNSKHRIKNNKRAV
jgi:hypothetical protein